MAAHGVAQFGSTQKVSTGKKITLNMKCKLSRQMDLTRSFLPIVADADYGEFGRGGGCLLLLIGCLLLGAAMLD